MIIATFYHKMYDGVRIHFHGYKHCKLSSFTLNEPKPSLYKVEELLYTYRVGCVAQGYYLS